MTSGDGVAIGALFGVAIKTAAAGETFTLASDGVLDLPRLTRAVIAASDPVAQDDTAKLTRRAQVGIRSAPRSMPPAMA